MGRRRRVVAFAVLPLWYMLVSASTRSPPGRDRAGGRSAFSLDSYRFLASSVFGFYPDPGAQPAALGGHDAGQPGHRDPGGVRLARLPVPASAQILAVMLAFAFFPGIVCWCRYQVFADGLARPARRHRPRPAELHAAAGGLVPRLRVPRRAGRGRGGRPGRRGRPSRADLAGGAARGPPGVAGTTALVFVASWNDFLFSSGPEPQRPERDAAGAAVQAAGASGSWAARWRPPC